MVIDNRRRLETPRCVDMSKLTSPSIGLLVTIRQVYPSPYLRKEPLIWTIKLPAVVTIRL